MNVNSKCKVITHFEGTPDSDTILKYRCRRDCDRGKHMWLCACSFRIMIRIRGCIAGQNSRNSGTETTDPWPSISLAKLNMLSIGGKDAIYR